MPDGDTELERIAHRMRRASRARRGDGLLLRGAHIADALDQLIASVLFEATYIAKVFLRRTDA